MASENRKPAVLRIVLFGDTGSGKSATGNTILGKRAFAIGRSRESETLTCQAERGEFEGTPVSVVDTPGSIWPNTSEMSKCISYCAPGPHAFLLVIPLSRVTDVDRQLKSLQRMFGEKASRYTIVLFPGGDKLPDGVTAEEFIHQHPVPYGVGYHVFNNRDEDPSQVRELLEKINRMVLRNGGSYCIKIKDWKHKYLYPFATAVTIGGGIGAASGGTGGGVAVAVVGAVIGTNAGADGNRAVATAVAGVGALAVGTAAGVGVGTGLAIVGRAGAGAVVGELARLGYSLVFRTVVMFCMVTFGAVGAVAYSGCGLYTVEVGLARFCVAAGCAAASLGVRFGVGVSAMSELIAVVVICAEVAAKAAAAIFAAAGTAGAAFEVFDVDKDHNVYFCANCAIIGGAGVGAGVSAVVRAYIHGVHDDIFVACFAASVVLVLVLCILFLSVRAAFSALNKTVGCAIVGVFAGAAFGAAVVVLGVSDVLGGVIIIIACKAVTWWLNRKG